MTIGGGVVGFLSGLVGSAGPLGAALFLSLPLSPLSYIASEAVTAVAMHIVKIVVYQKHLDLGLEAIKLGLFVGISMIAGTWAGKKIIERMPKDTFVKLVTLLLMNGAGAYNLELIFIIQMRGFLSELIRKTQLSIVIYTNCHAIYS